MRAADGLRSIDVHLHVLDANADHGESNEVAQAHVLTVIGLAVLVYALEIPLVQAASTDEKVIGSTIGNIFESALHVAFAIVSH